MKFKICLIVFLALLTVPSFASPTIPPAAVSLYQEANQAYEEGNWPVAIEKNQAALELTKANSVLFYNLGNAYYKAGELGRAIQYYQKALQLSPRDEDIKQNLNIARQHTQDQSVETSPGFALKIISLAHAYFSLNELTLFVVILYLAACALLIAYIYTRKPLLNLLVTLSILLLIFPSLSLAVKIYQRDFLARGVVVSKEAEIFSGPGDNYQHTFTLHEGVVCGVAQQRGDWLEIKLNDNLKGWVQATAVGLI